MKMHTRKSNLIAVFYNSEALLGKMFLDISGLGIDFSRMIRNRIIIGKIADNYIQWATCAKKNKNLAGSSIYAVGY